MGNCVSVHHYDSQPLIANGYPEAVTLVVGNEDECKARVARALAEARGANIEENTKAGVRIFSRELSPSAPVVIDTAPLITEQDWGLVDTARLWISQNSLRKLFGKPVVVVCVIASTDPDDEINQEHDFARNRFSWLHVLRCIFQNHQQQLMMLVNSEDSTDEASRRIPKLRDVLKRDGFMGQDNITFFNLRRDSGIELTATIRSVLQHSVYRGEAEDETMSATARPFLLRHVPWDTATDEERFGPWGPENVILFGRSGSGKSTLAQMLTTGRLHPQDKKLSISSSMRGETSKVYTAHGRGYRVVDTPGFGESINDGKVTIATAKARELLKTHVQLEEGTYSHFFYVFKKGRLDELDGLLWKEFKRAFEGIKAGLIKTHMTVVISDANREWLHENRDDNITHLKKIFEGCESFVPAYFPLSDDDDNYEAEEEVENLRQESLKEFEDEITSLHRGDISTSIGRWSKYTQRRNSKRSADDFIILRPSIRQTPAFGPAAPVQPQPSDYETARFYIRMNSWISTISSTFMPSR